MLFIMLCVCVFVVFCTLCAPIAVKEIAPLGTNKGIDWLTDWLIFTEKDKFFILQIKKLKSLAIQY